MILKTSKENIIKAAEEIKRGGIVAFPTETVYGLGADCTNPLAVSKIFEAKNRPSFNPLIVHVHHAKSVDNIAYIDNDNVEKIIDKFWPGPLTIVLPKKEVIPEIVTAGHSTVAVRMPSHPVALELIELSGTSIAAPSANSFGFLSPTHAVHVEKQLGSKVNIILDGGESHVGVESTIIEFVENKVKILRPGGLALEEIKKVVPEVEYTNRVLDAPNAPGMLFHHYAPSVPIKFLDEINLNKIDAERTGVLLFNGRKFNDAYKVKRVLTTSDNLNEAAANLFKYLHELENEDIDLILAEKVEQTGLGYAIMDRLTRAANRYR